MQTVPTVTAVPPPPDGEPLPQPAGSRLSIGLRAPSLLKPPHGSSYLGCLAPRTVVNINQ